MKVTPLSRCIASEIRAEMARQGVRASDLAPQVGLSLPTLYGRLNGKIDLRLGEVDRIAAALGLSLSDLLDRSAA